ncbi:uncharacterized protein LOC123318079 [Coccinella septempunctata]|uniref:uncharacterized protein LOC123318079 n=1 Tax=Coccinella septempunctata TaxID=41139 RepID=UPI001D072AB8|nr:uncharacterized protein LOC123318079 [Coccinella septempunctata]
MPDHEDQSISQLLVRNLLTILVVHRMTSFWATSIRLSSSPSRLVCWIRCISTRPLVVMTNGRIRVEAFSALSSAGTVMSIIIAVFSFLSKITMSGRLCEIGLSVISG